MIYEFSVGLGALLLLLVHYDDCSGGVAVLLEWRLEQWAAYGVPVGVWWGVVGSGGRMLLRLGRCFLLRHQLHKSCLGLLLVANPLQLNR